MPHIHLSAEEIQRRTLQILAAPKLDPRSRRRCPCGFEGTPNEIMAHMHGKKKRPECRGKITEVRSPSKGDNIRPSKDLITGPQEPQEVLNVQEVQEAQKTPQVQEPQEVLKAPVYEYRGADEELPEQKPEDAETVARRIREQLNQETPTGVGGDGRGELEGDFIVEQTTGPVSLQKVRQTVELPPIVLVWYDYFKNQGWSQGDGSISAFVTDFLLDHIRNCFGLRVVIVSETEVQIVEQSRAQ